MVKNGEGADSNAGAIFGCQNSISSWVFGVLVIETQFHHGSLAFLVIKTQFHHGFLAFLVVEAQVHHGFLAFLVVAQVHHGFFAFLVRDGKGR